MRKQVRFYIAGNQHAERVYFEAIHDLMRTFSPRSMAVFALEAAGGINVAAYAAARRGGTLADFGKERILARGDDIDVYLAQVGPMNAPTRDRIKNQTGFSLIRAVRTDQIYLIDEHIVSRPTPRILLGICTIGSLLYPEIFNHEAEELGCPP